jgi:hypothetical protein
MELDIIRYNTTWSACERQSVSYLFWEGEDGTWGNYTEVDEEKAERECSSANCTLLYFQDLLANENFLLESNCPVIIIILFFFFSIFFPLPLNPKPLLS